ncbi:MAG TPA: bifunctional DNA-formamidopyrimidine glycosylase/DNA-(apurinic or apyrimidinic site) lyase [Humisphaera sp.]|nr:bifunctional DNA-formamidopyrimidine glycosylase/DNA-(apurinic or apyrimidinic site) lyase [Humisphaera sp.]
MPELPEVQTVVDTLKKRLLGARITAVKLSRSDVLDPPDADLPALLTGRFVRSIDRRGKRIIFTLDDTNRFFIHLGMSGRLSVNSAADPLAAHTHLILDVQPAEKFAASGALELRFQDPRRFGGIWWKGSDEIDSGMGPEPLMISPKQLSRRLGTTTRAIKNALLDQSVLAGLGNIYVDESLFAAGIHPLTRADQLTSEQVRKLNRAIKTILRRAIRHRGSTLRDYRDAEGNAGGFQSLHSVYGHEEDPCRVCKTPIVRIVLGGRSTHFCPKCQTQ